MFTLSFFLGFRPVSVIQQRISVRMFIFITHFEENKILRIQNCFLPLTRIDFAGPYVFLIGYSKLSLHAIQVVHKAGAYPSFCSIKGQGVSLLPPGWGASPSQGYPVH